MILTFLEIRWFNYNRSWKCFIWELSPFWHVLCPFEIGDYLLFWFQWQLIWFPLLTWGGDLALGREVSWHRAVCAANPCLVETAILHLEPTDGIRGRDDGGKPRSQCYGIGHASSVCIVLDLRNRGLASAESQPRGLKEAFLRTFLRCRTCPRSFDTVCHEPHSMSDSTDTGLSLCSYANHRLV